MIKKLIVAAAFSVSSITLAAQVPQADPVTTSSEQPVPASKGSSATLSQKFEAVGKVNSGIGDGLHKIDKAKAFIKEAKDKASANKAAAYQRLFGSDTGSTTSSDGMRLVDGLSTKTKARLKRALKERDSVRERLKESPL